MCEREKHFYCYRTASLAGYLGNLDLVHTFPLARPYLCNSHISDYADIHT